MQASDTHNGGSFEFGQVAQPSSCILYVAGTHATQLAHTHRHQQYIGLWMLELKLGAGVTTSLHTLCVCAEPGNCFGGLAGEPSLFRWFGWGTISLQNLRCWFLEGDLHRERTENRVRHLQQIPRPNSCPCKRAKQTPCQSEPLTSVGWQQMRKQNK